MNRLPSIGADGHEGAREGFVGTTRFATVGRERDERGYEVLLDAAALNTT